jgi:dephospho-CoA kinase
MMLAVTGTTGAGKSTVLRMLGQLGAFTIDTDALAHEVLERDPAVREAVAVRFGASVVGPDGLIDRRKLAAAVFKSREGVAYMNGLIHPRVKELLAGIIKGRRGVVAVEVPLLFEARWEGMFDQTLCVIAPDGIVDERAGGNMRVERNTYQLGPEEKAGRADFVIRNDGTIDDLNRQVSKIYRKMIEHVTD